MTASRPGGPALLDEATLAALAARYREHGDAEALASLVADAAVRWRNLVWGICRRRFRADESLMDDLMQEVAVAVQHAARTHDPELGTMGMLSYQKICQRVGRAGMRQASRGVVNTSAASRFISFQAAKKRRERAGLPSDDESVFDALGWTTPRLRASARSLLRVTDAANWHDAAAIDPPAAADVAGMVSDVDQAADLLRRLTGRDREAVERYFGIGGPAMTYAEVGRSLGVSYQRARQLVTRSLARMRLAAGGEGVGAC